MTKKMAGQMSWFDRDTWYGKTCPERSAATAATISEPCWRSLPGSQNQTLLFLDLRKEDGAKPEPSSVMAGALHGELTMLNIGESPNAAVESRLSQILEDSPPPKYCLSAKDCQGILRRGERRGKDLPKLLKEVLIQQSQGASPQERTEAPAPAEAPAQAREYAKMFAQLRSLPIPYAWYGGRVV